MASIHYSDVVKVFEDVEVIRRLSLRVTNGEPVVNLGPSGSGKTTL